MVVCDQDNVAATVMRPSCRERPWDKVDVHWTTEVVPGASCDINGPTATVPWPFARRSLQGRLRLVTFHATSTDVRAVLCLSQSERGPSATRPWHITDVPEPSKTGSWHSHTRHGAEVSANQNTALVWPTVTPYGQEFGCPRAVRNWILTTVILLS